MSRAPVVRARSIRSVTELRSVKRFGLADKARTANANEEVCFDRPAYSRDYLLTKLRTWPDIAHAFQYFQFCL
jgi:hypothetical protein